MKTKNAGWLFEYETGKAETCTRQGCRWFGQTHYVEPGSQVAHYAEGYELEFENEKNSARLYVTCDGDGAWYVTPILDEAQLGLPWADFDEFTKLSRRSYQRAQRLNQREGRA